MTNQERLLAKLRALAEKGALSRSQCGTSLVKFLKPLLATQVVVEQRSGAGRTFLLRNRGALTEFIERNFPNDDSPGGMPKRVMGVRRFRNSKAFPSDNAQIVQVRAWKDGLLRKNGVSVPVHLETTDHGIFSFRISAAYTLHGPCALIENPVVFHHFESLGMAIGLVMYGGGHASNQLLNWLIPAAAADFSLLHLPDYDPVGVSEFLRLRQHLGLRVQLYLPDNLGESFASYSKRDLLKKRKNQALLASLRRSESPEVRRVVALMDLHNAGLEQEALFCE